MEKQDNIKIYFVFLLFVGALHSAGYVYATDDTCLNNALDKIEGKKNETTTKTVTDKKVTEKTTEKSPEKVPEKTAEKAIVDKKPAEIPEEIPEEKLAEKPEEKLAVKPEDKLTEKPTEKVTQAQAIEKPLDKVVDKPTDKTTTTPNVVAAKSQADVPVEPVSRVPTNLTPQEAKSFAQFEKDLFSTFARKSTPEIPSVQPVPRLVRVADEAVQVPSPRLPVVVNQPRSILNEPIQLNSPVRFQSNIAANRAPASTQLDRPSPSPSLSSPPPAVAAANRTNSIDTRGSSNVGGTGGSRSNVSAMSSVDSSRGFIPGQPVQVPRSNGSRSDGVVQDSFMSNGERHYAVTFENNNQRAVKYLSESELKKANVGGFADEIVPIATNKPKPNFIEGDVVKIPRSDGSTSDGHIAYSFDEAGERKHIVTFKVNGQDATKVLSDADLAKVNSKAIIKPDNEVHFKVGDSVDVPRTSGGVSKGNVLSVETRGDKKYYTVLFKNENGQTATKVVEVSDINKANASLLRKPAAAPMSTALPTTLQGPVKIEIPDSPAKSFLTENNLLPKHTHVLSDGQSRITTSDFFEDSGGRSFVVVQVETAAGKSNVVYYRSNSQSVFRQMPSYHTYIRWYDKGFSEDAMTAPIDMQKILNAQHKQQSAKTTINDMTKLEGVIKVYQSPIEESYQRNLAAARESFKAQKVLAAADRPLTDQKGRMLAEPKAVKFADPSDAPDYSKAVDTYTLSNKTYGEMTAEVFASKNGKMQFTVLRDSTGRVWFGDIGVKQSALNAQGLRTQYVDAGEMTAPLWEYREQIAKGYHGNRTQGNYVSNWNYVREFPDIVRYYKEKGLAMPGAD